MKSAILIFGALLSCGSVAAQTCDRPTVPSIAGGHLSERQERRVKREVLEYLTDVSRYVSCIRNEFRAAQALDAPDDQLQQLAAANNTAVEEVEELAGVYEERIGPIIELADLPPERQQPARFSPPIIDQPRVDPRPVFDVDGLPIPRPGGPGWPTGTDSRGRAQY